MKQVIGQITKSTLFAALLAATVFLFSNCSKDDASAGISLSYSLSGNASASQTVPANNSNGSGTFSGTYDARTKVMTYTSTWTNLSGAPLTAGLFSGASGQVGASITAWSVSGSGQGISGSISATTTLNAEQEANLLAGKMYYMFTTAARSSGEIRGQVTATAQ
ncbi:CHRD domain-containing protein [Sediminibacterium soli]|uniref:CHRD domain-containing protein n=1 Tax=Sediminibacterium soli TaxID=2698829 RepID=UPI00137B53EF|nr:CHRD domain-containing protein [Sediminibacterium soli]NCI45834.1 CHRD domain-containing protein [Sediminibacterium soli]